LASFSVNIVSNTTPAVSVTLSGTVTYQQFQNSLGNFVYEVDEAYLYSTNQRQIQGTFLYSKYDSNGNQNTQTIISAISPYQYQSSIYIDLREKNLILDGRDYINFNLLPNTTLQIKLFCRRIAVIDPLDKKGINNFTDLENSEGAYDFFEQYYEILD
jgi:hypothetical protein